MKVNRREALGLAGAAALMAAPRRSMAETEPVLGDDGLYVQPWFHQSFLDLREDLEAAQAAGKRLVVLWEQRGCPYCREMHRVDLAEPEIIGFIQAHYIALQLNLHGSREVTDFDGKAFEERRLAQRWKINFTPTLCFFPPTLAAAQGKSGLEAEAWRLQGYWKPFHFQGALTYVSEGAYESEPFQPWLAGYADRLRAQGKEVKLW
jgi:thioredoxin-related protein